MLSGKGNESVKKKNNNRSNQQKSNFARTAHTHFCTFLCRCFARLQREASRNFLVTRFMEEMSFSLSFTLVVASNSHFLTAATKFHVVPTTEKGLLCFFSLVLALFLVQLHWPVALLSLFLCISLSLYSKFMDPYN